MKIQITAKQHPNDMIFVDTHTYLARKTLAIYAPRKALGIFDHAPLRGICDFQPGRENTFFED